MSVNIIGVLGSELGFDALWYHLTLPKTYLAQHQVMHIPGSLLYYSDMPRLIEMIYAGALALSSEIYAKLIHFSFGILTLVALYKFSRKFFNPLFSLLVLVIFYSNLVVGWMSTTAYIDLARTFFELMALWGFVNWREKKENKWLIESAVMLGLAISTKLLAFGSLFIFIILIIISGRQKSKHYFKNTIKDILVYLQLSFLIPLPWFVFSFIHTGNPFFPFFSNLYKVHLEVQLFNPFFHKSDSISLFYSLILTTPFLFKKFSPVIKTICIYLFLSLIIWFLTPKTDAGRFVLPYLPALSILSVGVLKIIMEKKKILGKILIGLIIFISLFSITYRFVANTKYFPVLLGLETKSEFLSNHLNFSYGDFYDTDNYFKSYLKPTDKVLLYGFHNLYYVDFPFVDSTFVKEGEKFNYIAIQNGSLPDRFKYWNLVYQNPKTHVKLYSLGGQKWTY